MKKLVLRSLLLFVIVLPAVAQQDLYVGAFTDFGVPINHYAGGRKTLGGKGFNYQSNWGLMMQYKAFNRVGLEFGIAQNYSRWRIRDKEFAERHNGYKAVITNNHYYWGYFGALHFYQPLSDETNLYIGGGVFLNQIGSYAKSVEKNFHIENDTGFVNEDVYAETNYNSSNLSYYGEIGIQQVIGNNHTLSFGLKMNLGQGQMATGTYSIRNRWQQGAEMYNDKFTSWGDFVGINVKLGINLVHVDKKKKTPKVKPQPVIVDNKNKNNNNKTQPQPQPKPKPQPTKVEGRDVKVTTKLTVRNKSLKVLVWDHQEVDGDRISLKLDEMWILQNYTLSEKKKEVMITLKPGQNYLTLHALNLGRLSPNTAALIVMDGAVEHKIILESTLQQSGTIELTYNP